MRKVMNILFPSKSYFTLVAFLFTLISTAVAVPITPGERVTVSINGVPTEEQSQINGNYIVSDKGYLYLPMISNGIKASGLTSSQVARKIESSYRSAQVYNSPRITIITARNTAEEQTINSKFVTVTGNVKSPGPKPYRAGMTIYEAVAAAGDADMFGAMNRVELMRNNKVYYYDLRDPKQRTLKVYHGDTITVPEKNMFGR